MTQKTRKIEQDLQRRENAELITIITLMLEQQPELAWILQIPFPDEKTCQQPVDAALYRSQIDKAVSAAEKHYRDRTYCKTLENKLAALQTTADAFASQGDYLNALTICEVLVAAGTEHYFALDTSYLIFSPCLFDSIERLTDWLAASGKDQQVRQRVLRALFTLYRFSVDSSVDLDENIPALFTKYATAEERQMIAGWTHEVQSGLTAEDAHDKDRVCAYEKLQRRLKR
jgi:hypothetical protein